MTQPKELTPSRCPMPATWERAADRLARTAANDVYFGGARALTLLRRLERSDHYHHYEAAVSTTYHQDYAPEYTLHECPECGSPVYGVTAAAEHCFEYQPMED